ncbi:MAG: AbrB/MazE/SpoVT family DNA-binding domain-containing protein [Gammaproteobacteria bacterium]
MIILIAHQYRVSPFKGKSQTPAFIDLDRPMTSKLAFEWMIQRRQVGRAAHRHARFCGISAILQSMKATVTISSRGVITLPAKLRQALGLKADDHLIAETTPEGLLLRPAVTLAVELYTPEREREFDEAEAELATFLGRRAPSPKRATRSMHKRSR